MKMKKLKVFKDHKPRKKKCKPEVELTDTCDYCGKPLGRTCARTQMSSVCAEAIGIPIMRLEDGIRYFCCNVCFNSYWGRATIASNESV